MDSENSTTQTANANSESRTWDRRTVAELVVMCESAREQGISESQFAAMHGVPRTTLRYWLERKADLRADPDLVAFFESPAGLAFLHQLVGAAHIEFTQVGSCGVDRVCAFLERCGLDVFVATSHGAQHGVSVAIQELMIEYEQSQRSRLARQMTPKEIAACEDETFHPEICLVAIEPVSGFILLEGYSQQRDGHTWTERLSQALADLPVRIIQATTDQGRGLLAHVREGLGAHAAPDLFHIQQDLTAATSRPLRALLAAPAAMLAATEKRTQRWRTRQAEHLAGSRGPGRPPNFERHIAAAKAVEDAAREVYEAAQARCQAVADAIAGISAAYHPYDLTTGQIRSTELVAAELGAAFDTIRRVAKEAALAAKHRKRIAKARRLLPKMVGTVAFYYHTVDRYLAPLALPEEVGQLVRTELIPGLYLAHAARKAATAAERGDIRAVSEKLLHRARAPDSALMRLPPEERAHVERVAGQCADLFQRSSSCVEGRNGQLALRHHSLRRLSDRKLHCLTVVHDYYIRRADGTTAAERFFGAKPDDMFEWVLDQLDVPARPRTRMRPAA